MRLAQDETGVGNEYPVSLYNIQLSPAYHSAASSASVKLISWYKRFINELQVLHNDLVDHVEIMGAENTVMTVI
ncbi:predicted protein [Lichtheimia corymbifera JMRC:FSU:9682]|uniref:Uncharacterized protein n=1 Tax=Lichtheimia corymbifera JMRC:FSU:9682 TaxID=1263082 RepID=A0A068RHP8_9FUNG|nr:predicted protein [Lichtheimia corymbifera JMRC:FSU:9682]